MFAKKSLGQNFLRDEKVVEKILSAVSPCAGEVIVEVGPGEGVITEWLVESGATVVAIELDDRLIPILEEKFKGRENVYIVHGDILQVNIGMLLESYKLQVTSYKLVGNLPYYITSAIVRKFLEVPFPPREMFLMMQKEVAERIVAGPGKMSILSVAVQYYAVPEMLFVVPKESFDPVPKVESAFIRLTNKTERRTQNAERGKRGDKLENEKLKMKNEEGQVGDAEIKKGSMGQGIPNHPSPLTSQEFFRLVKIGFSARRKTLVNNLANGFHWEKGIVSEWLLKSGLSEKARAQDLSVSDWGVLLGRIMEYNESIKNKI